MAGKLDLDIAQITFSVHMSERTNTVYDETFIFNRCLESLQTVPYKGL